MYIVLCTCTCVQVCIAVSSIQVHSTSYLVHSTTCTGMYICIPVPIYISRYIPVFSLLFHNATRERKLCDVRAVCTHLRLTRTAHAHAHVHTCVHSRFTRLDSPLLLLLLLLLQPPLMTCAPRGIPPTSLAVTSPTGRHVPRSNTAR